MTSQLFRKEATEAQRQRLYGEVTLAQPLSFALFAGFLVVCLIALSAFIATGSYARKETATGFLQPDKGVIKVTAPTNGVIAQVHVDEGEAVAEGARLITVVAEQVSGAGRAVDTVMLETLQAQLGEIESRLKLEEQRLQAEEAKLSAELEGYRRENVELAEQIRVQRDLIEVARENLAAIEDLTERGVVSGTEYKARKERVLSHEQQLAAFKQQRVSLTNRIEQTALALARLPMESAERASQLSSARAELERRRAELEGRRSVTLTAPVAGTVTALQAVQGGQAGTRPLLSLLPEGGQLEAQLYVPSRAIGFVEPGQPVKLQYDAFNYRRFGVFEGTVRDVSATILSPEEVPGQVQLQEPAYRVTVSLASQGIDAYGKAVPLQAGMTLSADIILERRSLVDWLLDPLMSLKGRG